MAYLPGSLFLSYCRLLTAYWSDHLRLIGQAYCNTLSNYWSSSHPAYPELLRLTKQFFNILILCLPYRLGFSPQPQKNILVSHSRINPAPWKYLIYTNPAQGFLPDRLQNTPKIPVFQSRTPKINRYFSCAQSPRRAKNDIFARWYKVCTVLEKPRHMITLTNPGLPAWLSNGYNGYNGGGPSARLFGWSAADWSRPAANKSISFKRKRKKSIVLLRKEIMNKLVIDLLQQKWLGCWKVLKKRCKKKEKGFLSSQLTSLLGFLRKEEALPSTKPYIE